jgi:membrane-associated phospholipid phosphatase
MVESITVDRDASRKHLALATGACLIVYGTITALVASRLLTPWDVTVREWLSQRLPPQAILFAKYAAYLGQGGPLTVATLCIAVLQSWRLRTLKPALLWFHTAACLYILVGTFKIFSRRGAPADPQPDAVEFFSKPFCGGPECMSYPSGHVANVIVWYGLAAILLGHRVHNRVSIVARVVLATLVTVATTVSGYHWLTDSAAGIFIGLAIYLSLRLVDDFRISAAPVRRLTVKLMTRRTK